MFGLARGCGATVVARALATELGLRDPSGSAAVHSSTHPGGVPLATRAAARLAHALEDVPGAGARAVGRLCLVDGADPMALAGTTRYFAPLVLDAGSASLAGPPATVPDRTVLVALPALEPALAAVASACLARVGPDPLVVLNRADGDDRWSRRADVQLPDSRIGARLALGAVAPRRARASDRGPGRPRNGLGMIAGARLPDRDGSRYERRLSLRRRSLRANPARERGGVLPLHALSAPHRHGCVCAGEDRRAYVPAAAGWGPGTGVAPAGRGFEKCFCRRCGSQLFSRNPDDPTQMSIRLSAFDGDPGVRPSWRAYVAYAAAWEPIPDDGLERFAEAKARTPV